MMLRTTMTSLVAAGLVSVATHARVAAQETLPKTVTFAEHIAPIIFASCTSCHRDGEPAPFVLKSYRDVSKRGRMIRRVTKSRYMPPWHPEEGWGEFKDSLRLSEKQLDLIDRWVETGMAEGDPKKTPAVPKFPDGWRLGEPDLVVSMTEAYEVPASGPDIYRNFVVPLDLDEDRWVRAVEIRPSARPVLHHTLYFLDSTGAARKLDARSRTPGFSGMGFRRTGSLGGWAVGATPRFLPVGLARPLAAGSDLILSTHFHPSGKVEHEKTTVGLYFAKEAPSRSFTGFQIPPLYGSLSNIDIPAGESNYVVRDSFTLPIDIDLVSVGAHCHYIGKSMQAVATLPDGSSKKLFRIADWDFNWQGRYQYAEPIRLPAGTRIDAVITWDNSADNPRNPYDPPRRIRWGARVDGRDGQHHLRRRAREGIGARKAEGRRQEPDRTDGPEARPARQGAQETPRSPSKPRSRR